MTSNNALHKKTFLGFFQPAMEYNNMHVHMHYNSRLGQSLEISRIHFEKRKRRVDERIDDDKHILFIPCPCKDLC